MGDAVVRAFLPLLLQKLADREVLEYIGRLKGVNKMVLQKWTTTLTAIEGVLNDAEEKQLTQEGVRLWLDDLRDLAYDVEDILDAFAAKMLKRRIQRQQGCTSMLWISSLSKPKFNFSVNSEIKDITDRLEEITNREKQFGLKKLGVSTKPWKMPQTTSLIDGPVIGRDEDKKKIVDHLLSKQETCTSNFQNFQVLAVVGTGGLGKTTLAKHVFNDAATQQFSPKGWVSVSDDFDIVRVTAAILEAVTSGHVTESKELNSIQEKLSKELAGKKFLIVLDDVWDTCSYDQWTTLQSPFRVGAVGSMILVTTRDANVAKMVGDTNPYNLGLISEDDCWKIFEHHALLNDRTQNVKLLKEKVIVKCKGLPLAARTLGGLLRCRSVDEWEEILDHKMWNLSEKTGILPALKLSYHYLPSNLKRCFTYCAILPNDYEFREKQLILLWMAEGLIQQQPEENKQMEDLGSDYFKELVSRSLFQKPSKDGLRYIMHDLVTDLARWAAGKTCRRLEDKPNYDSQLRCLPKVRHSSYIRGMHDGAKKFEVYSEVVRMRTFLPLNLSPHQLSGSFPLPSFLAHKVPFDLLPKLQYLRVLSFHTYRITELPNTIGKLKHLRYLDLSHTYIRSLPDSISSLCNLQTLILEGCSQLKALPTSMRNLINLRHLNNTGVPLLEQMPPQLGRLTNLQTLPNFVVGKGSGSGVREIGSLLHLQGTLHLSKLENVIGVEDARSATLQSKERLEALSLEWSNLSVSTEIAAVVLDMLQPHRKLKELNISGYAGLKFASWIGDPSFSNMVHVRLQGCNHCQFLPPFGQLSSLKTLHIQGMDAVESVGSEFYGEGNLPFQALETLVFRYLENWKEWSPCQQDLGIGILSCLKMLSIADCPKLEGSLPEKLDSLENLSISGCEKLVMHTSPVHFEFQTESLGFLNISALKFQTKAFMKSLEKVKYLGITGCEELMSSFQNEGRLLQHLISLDRLHIEDNSALVEKLGKEAEQLLQLRILDCKLESLVLRNCRSLLKVPEGLHHLTSLQDLGIYECSNLVSFPDVGLPSSLKRITIRKCDSLLYFARYQIPSSLERIEIKYCENLKSLIETEEVVVESSSSYCLEFLAIGECPSLMSLLFKSQLPRALKQLHIWNCSLLELITDRFLDDSQLEQIHITTCPNLKFLPEGLCHLTNLQSFSISGCQSLVSLSSMSVGIIFITITDCKKLEVVHVLRDMQHNKSLNSLAVLRIDDCEGLISCFPPNLTQLDIWKMKNCKALLESQGLHSLTSLRWLSIKGKDDPSLVSFPITADKEKENKNEMMFQLPKSLIGLIICGFPNLKKLSNGFQFLNSLERLTIKDCPKLASIPEEGLPLSLEHFTIDECPLLEKRCKGRYRPKIAHISFVRINNREI
ncbi:hypothetical protein M0R45_037879 [Rubus argutus]|uniref:P-loop containing nucleoside triphosphate hydrolase, leucine-rich repeat domain, L n=1 Tax=Rubus argutus TaxID=59490 RepID=A0AAW1W3F3_RUBAR